MKTGTSSLGPNNWVSTPLWSPRMSYNLFPRAIYNFTMFTQPRGLLLSHKLIGILEKSSGKFNYANYIMNRWLKLSIPLFGAILLYYIMPMVGSGPIWNECDGYFQPGCKDWSIIMSNFLYYSNFNILTGKYFFGIVSKTTVYKYIIITMLLQ